MLQTVLPRIDFLAARALTPTLTGLAHPHFNMPSVIYEAPAAPIEHIKRRCALPAVWMRAGTSKGLYLHRQDLPRRQEDWSPIITRAMGSYDSDPKQLNGVGGATSTTSKVAVVSRSSRPGVDVDYTFVQVAVGSSKLDFTGNCGNIASGVGPFAVDEGLVQVNPGQREVKVRVYNTNTDSVLTETLDVDDTGRFQEDGDCTIPGLASQGSKVQMAFSRPAGSMTGTLLPSGNPIDTILIQENISSAPVPVRVSLVDAANPFIWVDATTLPGTYHDLGPHAEPTLNLVETIRRKGAVLMGLAGTEEQASLTRGTPKIAVLSAPKGGLVNGRPGVQVTSYSMGKVHGSLQLTGAVCLGSAACVPGTVPYEICNQHPTPKQTSGQIRTVSIRHPGGDMDVDVRLHAGDEDAVIEDVTVFRTARRLFEGRVVYLM